MGGGGAMRTAMKVAGFGVANSGLRGVPMAPAAEQSVMKTSRTVSATVSSQGVKAATAEVAAAPVHTAASWDMNDWEFADTGELVMEAGEPMPRVVFTAVPSFQEAKAATTELKEAIDELYLSSSSSNKGEVSSDGGQVSVQLPHSELETKSCESELLPTPVPKHALQAFQFLSASSEAQTVVASVVSDPDVWNAVMKNAMLNDFLQSHEQATGSEMNKSSIKLEELPDSDENSCPRNGFFDSFNDVFKNIKLTVAEMISSVSSYLHDLFGFLSPEKTGSDGDEKPRPIFTDQFAMTGTVMGLAVLVAMVVLFKRV